MRFDVTKLPLGELLVGFVLAAVALTFILAFVIGAKDGGVGGQEASGEEAAAEMSPTAEGTPSGGDTGGGGTAVDIAMIPVNQFNKVDITVPAGQPVTLTADNQEPSMPHNWALYTDESASELIAATALCADCTETVTLDPLEPGEYFFRCDVHPIQMVGRLVVEG